jgi:hypothetical protein
MSNNNRPTSVADRIDATARLVFLGANVLHDMLSVCDNEDRVSFQRWATTLRELDEVGKNCTTDEHLIWLWETLRTAPDLCAYFGDLPSATNPWTSTHQHFDVFEPGECFFIGMTKDEVAHLLKPTQLISHPERVRLQTMERLQMRPGKGHRLECCDCRSEVTILVDKVFSLEREADIMRIEQDRIELGDGYVKVQVDSLNQAYTVASRRLEPKRRSHGGRTYDHLVHIGNEKRTRLEDIRQLVESGSWPSSIKVKEQKEQIEKLFQEPQQWGLRGDPFLWRELRQHFIETGLPATLSEFMNRLESQFRELVGVSLATDQESVFIQRYAHGGMSSGQIVPDWWRRTGMPLLKERFSMLHAQTAPQSPRGVHESH